MYIFDEPSAGLHPSDNARVLDRLALLKEKGNSVVVIEHDAETVQAMDHVIDVGPGGGRRGGQIVFSGDVKGLYGCTASATAREMLREPFVPKALARPEKTQEMLSIQKASLNNISKLSLDVPLQSLVVVAGVSGAGKSSLVHGIISDTLQLGKRKAGRSEWKLNDNRIAASIDIERVLLVDQKPIGRNPRSAPASYLGIWDHIRKLFSATVEAKTRGWTSSFFSFNTGDGRCSECKGQGQTRLDMTFLADATLLCDSCAGSRFSDQANSIRYLDLSVSETLQLTFDEARLKFASHRKIHQPLHQACELGLGYLTLGQPSPTLSGGESQRLKLVSELSARRKGHSLYILDEPTTGLHPSDVGRLLKVLRQLVALGNSVLVIEHDRDLVFAADHLIELGPGPGDSGGKIIFQGHPSELEAGNTPWARLLQKAFQRSQSTPSRRAAG